MGTQGKPLRPARSPAELESRKTTAVRLLKLRRQRARTEAEIRSLRKPELEIMSKINALHQKSSVLNQQMIVKYNSMRKEVKRIKREGKKPGDLERLEEEAVRTQTTVKRALEIFSELKRLNKELRKQAALKMIREDQKNTATDLELAAIYASANNLADSTNGAIESCKAVLAGLDRILKELGKL